MNKIIDLIGVYFMIYKGIKSKVGSIFTVMIIVLSGLLILLSSMPEFDFASAESTWTQTSDTDFYKGSFNYTMVNGTGDSAELKLVAGGQSQWINKTRIGATDPGPLWAHDMAPIYGTDKVLLFGGSDDTNVKNETWIYDLSDNTWTKKTYSTEPSGRFHHGMAPVYNEAKVVLFGGYTGSTDLNDTWVYDYNTDSWTQKKSHPLPASDIWRYRPASHRSDDKFVLFGGGPLNTDTYVYDLSLDTWTKKTTTTNPSARLYHRITPIDGTDKEVLFSGLIGMNTNDTWVFDFSDGDWTEKSPVTTPSARINYGMATIYGTTKIIIFGGLAWPKYYDDAWIYDSSQGTDGNWVNVTPLVPTSKPGPREGGIMAPIHGTNSILLFGGRYYNGVSDIYLNDTWVYSHGSKMVNGTYTSMAYNTTSESNFKTLSWDAYTPPGTSIKLQLRTSTNGSKLFTKSFVGPDGTSGTYYTQKGGEAIWSGHNGDSWIQYKVQFYYNGNTSPTLKDITITYNCLPSTTMLSPLNGTLLSINTPTFYWNFSDSDSTHQQSFQVLIDDDPNFNNPEYDTDEQITTEEYWEFPIGTDYTEMLDGIWYWKVRTKDQDDAWTEYSEPWTLQIDTKPPTSILTFPINYATYYSLDVITGETSDGEDGSGVVKTEIAIRTLLDDSYWDGTGWKSFPIWLPVSGMTDWSYDCSAVPWKSGINYTVQSRAIDNATNVEVPSITIEFSIDRDGPESIIESPTDLTWLNHLYEISGTSIDKEGSGVEQVDICIECTMDLNPWDGGPEENQCWDGTDWISDEFWLTTSGATQWNYNTSEIIWMSGDQYSISARATDGLGNIEDVQQGITFMYDSSPPHKLTVRINSGDEFTNSNKVELSLHAEDIGSGIGYMSFSNDSLSWSSWEPFAAKRSMNLAEGDGEKTVYFKARDNVGNIAEHVMDTIILDTTPPQDLSIEILEEGVYTKSNRVSLNLHAIDLGSGLDEMTFSIGGNIWFPWEPFNNTKHITFSAEDGDGEKVIYFKVRDKLGAISESVSDSIILDTTPPHSLWILINNGVNETDSTSVTLTLQAKDSTSGVSKISFSTDGQIWSDWENYTESKSFELSASVGVKTIYFKAMDAVGNIAEPVSSSIILKTTKPTKPTPTTESPSSKSDLYQWIIILAIIIVAIILIVTFVLVLRRKKLKETQPSPMGTLTIHPETLSAPAISTGEPPGTLEQPQAPAMAPAEEYTKPLVTPPEPAPRLATPEQPAAQLSASSEPEAAQLTEPEAVPQLPPATINGTKPEDIMATPDATMTTPEATEKETNQTPTQQDTTTTASEAPPETQSSDANNRNRKNGPTVHLPD